jgi:Ca2+-binding EF-hand superfamily protein
MGNRQNFEVNYGVPGQGPDVLITLDHLGLTIAESGKFWRAFCRIDRQKTGKIDRQGSQIVLDCLKSSIEFYRHYRIKESPCLNLIFTSLSNKSSKINFEEFVIILWDFLSQEIALYCFMLFDPKRARKLPFDVIQQMISMIHGSDYDSIVDEVVRTLEIGDGEKISSSDFATYTKENKILLRPICRTQSYLRAQIIGEVYWRSMTDIRTMKLPNKTVIEIISRREDEIDANQVKITL